MHLRGLRLKNFRSVAGPVELKVDGRVTVLVGANDHGKSNLLAGLQAINDDRPLTEADRNWDASDNDDCELVWEFELSEADRSALALNRAQTREAAKESTDPEEAEEAEEASQPSEPETPPPSEPALPTVIYIKRTDRSDDLTVESPEALSPQDCLFLLERRPQLELFMSPSKIADSVTLAQLEKPECEFMKGIFLKAGIWDQRETIFAQTARTSRTLDDASERLTACLKEEWEQGRELSWKLKHAPGENIQLLIMDPSVSVRYVLPSQRSTGFTAFFVLSLTLYARTWNKSGRDFIYLFDEPGTYLHPVAQVNLQRVFEAIAQNNQIVYTTHSVFLVNKNEPLRNRVVVKNEAGTEVDKKPFARNWKAIRESLGIVFANNFFVANRTLLVEGPSDEIYLLASLLYLIRRDALDIDLNAFSIVDGGDEANYIAMAKIMLAEGRRVHCLLDGDSHGRRVSDRLKRLCAKELEAKDLEFSVLPSNCSIEDIVPHRPLLARAASDASRWLVETGQCELKPENSVDGLQLSLEEECTLDGQTETLGNRIVSTVAKHFAGRERISKLNIACRYEDTLRSLDDGEVDKPGALSDLIENMRGHLELSSRRSGRDILES